MRPRFALDLDSDTRLLAVALAALGASTLLLVALREDETVMFAVSFGAIMAAALLGLPHRPLATLAVGVAAIIWALFLMPTSTAHATSTASHAAVGALAAWVLTEPLRHRLSWTRGPIFSRTWFAIPLLVLAAAGVWELGEWMGNVALDGTLSLGFRDTSGDLVAGFLGAVAALTARDLLSRRRTA